MISHNMTSVDILHTLVTSIKVPVAMDNSHMLEYVIQITFIPKIPLTRPD